MFKKKAFLISLALLASNFLLPNQVRSGLEVGEEITSEKKEVNFKIERKRYRYFFSIISRDFPAFDEQILCSGETLFDLNGECNLQFTEGIGSSLNELLFNLGEEEEDLEEEIEEVVVEDEVAEEEEVEEEEVVVEKVETTEAEDIDFDSITKADLPLKVYCPDRGADLIIREKTKEKGYVVKITRLRGERFFDGRKFRKAVKKFKKALENEC